jgi:hypothetical protein
MEDCRLVLNWRLITCFAIILFSIHPLLSNDSVNTFPREATRTKIGCLLLRNGSVNNPQQYRGYVFCVFRAEGL